MPPNEKTEKRKAYEKEMPCLPDPEEKGARFLGWIKKRGFYATFEECEAYCSSIEMDLKEFSKNMGRDHIMIGRTSRQYLNRYQKSKKEFRYNDRRTKPPKSSSSIQSIQF